MNLVPSFALPPTGTQWLRHNRWPLSFAVPKDSVKADGPWGKEYIHSKQKRAKAEASGADLLLQLVTYF